MMTIDDDELITTAAKRARTRRVPAGSSEKTKLPTTKARSSAQPRASALAVAKAPNTIRTRRGADLRCLLSVRVRASAGKATREMTSHVAMAAMSSVSLIWVGGL